MPLWHGFVGCHTCDLGGFTFRHTNAASKNSKTTGHDGEEKHKHTISDQKKPRSNHSGRYNGRFQSFFGGFRNHKNRRDHHPTTHTRRDRPYQHFLWRPGRPIDADPIVRDWFIDMMDWWRTERRWSIQRYLCEVQRLC